MTAYVGWDYPPPGDFSTECRDEEGYLRVSGPLLKKGGSRRRTNGVSGLSFRRNWSDRYFHMDLAESTLRYYFDKEMQRKAGEVRFLPGKTKMYVPEDVILTGRHKPKDGQSLDYMELLGTADDQGKERSFPFALRTATLTEFNEWRRTFAYVIKSQGLAGLRRGDEEKREDDSFEEAAPVDFDDDDDFYDADDGSRLTQSDLRDMAFYYQDASQCQGPVSLDALRTKWQTNAITSSTSIYAEPLRAWYTIAQVPALGRLLAPPSEDLATF